MRPAGLEVELLAPQGKTRHDLASAIAQSYGGSCKRIFYPQSEPSKVGVNPHCRRLGCWPDELLTLVQARGFDTLGWDAVLFKLKDLPLTKYCDFNLVNLLNKSPDKFTIEFRIMPSTLDADRIEDWAKLFRKILHQAVSLDEDLALVDGLDSWLTAKNWDPK